VSRSQLSLVAGLFEKNESLSDVKGEATVKFDVGSSKVSATDQEELKKLADTAVGLKGYIMEVTGYAASG
jgi:hypothetical protein